MKGKQEWGWELDLKWWIKSSPRQEVFEDRAHHVFSLCLHNSQHKWVPTLPWNQVTFNVLQSPKLTPREYVHSLGLSTMLMWIHEYVALRLELAYVWMAPSKAESACVWLWLTLSNPVNPEKYWRAHSTEWNALILILLQQHTALGEMEEAVHFYVSWRSFSKVLETDCESTVISSVCGELRWKSSESYNNPRGRIHSWLTLCIMFSECCSSSKLRPFSFCATGCSWQERCKTAHPSVPRGCFSCSKLWPWREPVKPFMGFLWH